VLNADETKARRAHQLRLKGLTWEQTAERVGYFSSSSAQLAVRAFLQRAVVDEAKEVRAEALALELERLDVLQAAWWDAANSGDVKAAAIVLKISNQRSKLRNFYDDDRDTASTKTIVITGTRTELIGRLKQIAGSANDEPIDAELVDD